MLRHFFLWSCAVASLTIGLTAQTSAPQTRTTGNQHRQYTFAPTGQQMPYRVFVPPTWDGKASLPIILMLQNRQNRDLGNVRDLLLREEATDGSALRDMIIESGSIQSAASVALRMMNEGRDALDAVPTNRYVTGLQAIADHLIKVIAQLT